MKSIRQQVQEALRVVADEATSREEAETLARAADRISERAARKLRSLLK